MAKEETPTTAAAITAEQIAAWKKKHGKVYKVESEGKVGYLRRPDRKIISAATVIGNGDNLKSKEVVIGNCWLGGDEELKTDDKYFLALAGLVDEMIEIAQMELKEV